MAERKVMIKGEEFTVRIFPCQCQQPEQVMKTKPTENGFQRHIRDINRRAGRIN